MNPKTIIKTITSAPKISVKGDISLIGFDKGVLANATSNMDIADNKKTMPFNFIFLILSFSEGFELEGIDL